MPRSTKSKMVVPADFLQPAKPEVSRTVLFGTDKSTEFHKSTGSAVVEYKARHILKQMQALSAWHVDTHMANQIYTENDSFPTALYMSINNSIEVMRMVCR